MQNAALRTVTGCTQDTNIQHLHDETLILPIYEYLSSTRHNTNRKHNIHPSHPLHSKAKNTLYFINGRYTTSIRHIHTFIVSRYLATIGNNKILRTPPPHISSSQEILPCLTRLTHGQPRTNKSSRLKSYRLKSYLHKVDAKSSSLPLFLFCNTHIHNTHHLYNRTHIRTALSPLNLWTNPARVTALLARWTENLPGGPQTARSDSPPPPIARVIEVAKQKQNRNSTLRNRNMKI